MGQWGPGLYEGDFATDLREELQVLLRAPLDAEGLEAALVAQHPEATDPADEEHTDFWLVFADQLHRHGLSAPVVFARALGLFDLDLQTKSSLGLGPADLRRRKRELDALAVRLASPHPKPRSRRVVTRPAEMPFPEGAVLAYPTQREEPINPYFSAPQLAAQGWRSDGWGALLLLRSWQPLGIFASGLFAKLELPTETAPDLETCSRAPILLDRSLDGFRGRVGVCTLSPEHARKMKVVLVGRLPLDPQRVDAVFGVSRTPPPYRDLCVSNLMGPAPLLNRVTGPLPPDRLRVSALLDAGAP